MPKILEVLKFKKKPLTLPTILDEYFIPDIANIIIEYTKKTYGERLVEIDIDWSICDLTQALPDCFDIRDTNEIVQQAARMLHLTSPEHKPKQRYHKKFYHNRK